MFRSSFSHQQRGFAGASAGVTGRGPARAVTGRGSARAVTGLALTSSALRTGTAPAAPGGTAVTGHLLVQADLGLCAHPRDVLDRLRPAPRPGRMCLLVNGWD